MAGVVDRSVSGGAAIMSGSRAWLRHLIALLLVLAAAAFVVLALTTGRTGWAWASIGVSAVVAVGLVVDAVTRRRAGDASDVERARSLGDSPEQVDQVDRVGQNGTGVDESAEEDTDAADLLLVAELTDEVRVVDEHPRYHLDDCPSLAGRTSLPLPLREARELEFTPCARCRPDATLAARQRGTVAGRAVGG